MTKEQSWRIGSSFLFLDSEGEFFLLDARFEPPDADYPSPNVISVDRLVPQRLADLQDPMGSGGLFLRFATGEGLSELVEEAKTAGRAGGGE